MDEWYTEDCMEAPLTLHMRESCAIKSQIHDDVNPTYMEALSGKYTDEYYKAADYKTQINMIRKTWDIFPRKSVDNPNVLPGTWYFMFNIKLDQTIRKLKARYCVRGDFQKRLYPEPLNVYSPVFQWDAMRFMFIF